MAYPKLPYVSGKSSALLHCDRMQDAIVRIRPELPGNVIVIHGVNDVGTSFGAVEKGLCQGLDARMYGGGHVLTPAAYRMPQESDKREVIADPDAIYFKRQPDDTTYSPVIPFYWGFREQGNASKVVNGQNTDRYGNRLDKDMSKNGGPFGNATNTLPDMWNKGLFSPYDVGGDPVRPLMTAPGRMYMVLAAKRLAALIAMIRDYDSNDVVSIVAHSQGCLISLLAQAFLLDEGKRPADTLILTHPPYSLVEDTTMFFGAAESSRIFGGGQDAVMRMQYMAINDRQTFHARLQTLVQIVHGVVEKKHATPAFAQIKDHAVCHGMAGAAWRAEADRDNRGKVYLYFCPEDMTVALDNMQGIGWQGVPDHQNGHGLSTSKGKKEGVSGAPVPPIGKRSIKCASRWRNWGQDSTSASSPTSSGSMRLARTTGRCWWACRRTTSPCAWKARTTMPMWPAPTVATAACMTRRRGRPSNPANGISFPRKRVGAKACARSMAKPCACPGRRCWTAARSALGNSPRIPTRPSYRATSKGRARKSTRSMRPSPLPVKKACENFQGKSSTILAPCTTGNRNTTMAPSVRPHSNRWSKL